MFIQSVFEISQICILDVSGRMRLQFENHSAELPLDISSLSSGIYLVEVTLEKGRRITKRFVIQ
jgi:hypothetical protein